MYLTQYWDTAIVPREVQDLVDQGIRQNPTLHHRMFSRDSADAYIGSPGRMGYPDLWLPFGRANRPLVGWLVARGGDRLDLGRRKRLSRQMSSLSLSISCWQNMTENPRLILPDLTPRA